MKSRILIDSRDAHPGPTDSPFSYYVPFYKMNIGCLKSVSRIELKAICFPKIQNELYFLLKLGDLDTSFVHSHPSSSTNECFGVIYFDNGSMAPGTYKPIKGADFCTKSVEYVTGDKPVLKGFNVEFLTHAGKVVTPADTGGEVYHNLLFEIEHH